MRHALTTVVALAGVALIPSALPQESAQPSRSRASRLLLEGRLDLARREWTRIVDAAPEDGAAWFQLAAIASRAGRVGEAREAYERACSAPGVAVAAHYALAAMHARAGETEDALGRLRAALGSGLVLRSQLLADESFASLRGSAEFQELARTAVELPAANADAPTRFAEDDVEVLWEFRADDGLARFGWQTEAIGDLNGDGVPEIVGGAPRASDAAERGGKAFVLSGKDGSVLRVHVGEDAGGQLGYRSKPAPDLNGDDCPDYLVTAPGANSRDGSVPPDHAGLDYPGHVFVYSGRDGDVLMRLDAGGPSERFGFDAAAVGDLDGDDVSDLLIGAPGHDEPVANAGCAYLFSGATGELLRKHVGEVELERLGAAIGALGDVDGDDVPDYVIGAPGAGPARGGRAYVVSGRTGARLHVLTPDEDPESTRAIEFGRFFASSAGDVDGDGANDVYVADCFEQGTGPASGRVYVFSSGTGERLLDVGGAAANDWYGIGRGLREDVDGDGVPDLVVTALNSNAGAVAGGRVDILSGRDGSRLRTLTCATPYLSLAYDAHPVGDIDGDGVGDLFLAGSWAPWAPELVGRGVLVRGRRVER